MVFETIANLDKHDLRNEKFKAPLPSCSARIWPNCPWATLNWFPA